jgi:HSP20 family molecular chaperone IbpA
MTDDLYGPQLTHAPFKYDEDAMRKALMELGQFSQPNPYFPYTISYQNILVDNTINIQEAGEEVQITIEVPGAKSHTLSIEYINSKSFTVRWIKPFMNSSMAPENKEKTIRLNRDYKLDMAYAYLKDGQLYVRAFQGNVVRNTISLQPEPHLGK